MKHFLTLISFLSVAVLSPQVFAESGFFAEPMITYQNLKYDSAELQKLGPFTDINAQDQIEF